MIIVELKIVCKQALKSFTHSFHLKANKKRFNDRSSYFNRLKKIAQTIFICKIGAWHWGVVYLQVALKRQQAVEDAIALRLASNETGKSLDSLPPGKIFGMTITEPKSETSGSLLADVKVSENINKKHEVSPVSSTSKSPLVSQNAIEMLSSLFPHRKRSVLELVLRRCDLDLLRYLISDKEMPIKFFFDDHSIIN